MIDLLQRPLETVNIGQGSIGRVAVKLGLVNGRIPDGVVGETAVVVQFGRDLRLLLFDETGDDR